MRGMKFCWERYRRLVCRKGRARRRFIDGGVEGDTARWWVRGWQVGEDAVEFRIERRNRRKSVVEEVDHLFKMFMVIRLRVEE